jgi:hypothetical protein
MTSPKQPTDLKRNNRFIDEYLDQHNALDESRRQFLSGMSSAVFTGAAGIVAFGSASNALAETRATAIATAVAPGNQDEKPALREAAATKLRNQATKISIVIPKPRQKENDDQKLYSDQRASFFKTLPQNNLAEVDLNAYNKLVTALDSGLPSDFSAIQLATGAVKKLVNPQSAYSFEMSGGDPQQSRIALAPAFASAVQAAEMGELYWQALTRDVPFLNYSTNSLIASAVADLNTFSAKVGPTVSGSVTAGTLFRGETPGDLIGPYISQFLLKPIPFGAMTINQLYKVPVAGSSFMTTRPEFLAIQRGANPASPATFESSNRYIYNGRTLCEYVHTDFSFQAFLNAALIMLSFGPAALSPTNPYIASTNQAGFATLGGPDILDQVSRAANIGLKTAWYQKWQVHRRLRPEVFASRVDSQRSGAKAYGIHADIFNSAVMNSLAAQFGNVLLPQAFPEGSPAHPSYPAGHAAISGACATILKAFFNENFVVPNPVEANLDGTALQTYSGSVLTLGNEIDKLAANISIGRDAAGVHYRSDGIQGMLAGEQVAVPLLQEYSMTYNEVFDGFTLRRFNGARYNIKNGEFI